MGFIKNIVTSQLIDVIEWKDDTQNTMVHRYDMNGKEIMMGAQLTVRENQAALFINEGKAADLFGPGRYEISTQNVPILTTLRGWKYGFQSPFKAEVYFFNTRLYTEGLGFAGILCLIGILCSLATTRLRLLSAAVAGVAAVATFALPLKLNILVAIAAAVILCLTIEDRFPSSAPNQQAS